MNTCGNCEEIIYGIMYITADDFILCGDCWYSIKDDLEVLNDE